MKYKRSKTPLAELEQKRLATRELVKSTGGSPLDWKYLNKLDNLIAKRREKANG